MDQDELVRKSIVRISFKWPNRNNKKETLTVVICGVIVSIKDDGSCLVLADPTFFREKNCPFVVNLPSAVGYDAVPVAPTAHFLERFFCTLVLQVQANDYVRPVTIETGAVRTLDRVCAFVFPRADYLLAARSCPGSIVHIGGGQRNTLKIGIPFHSFGHFGSPIFNQMGHLVGISYSPTDAWSVSFLRYFVFRNVKASSLLGSVSYVLNGDPIPPEGPNLPDGQVPPI